MLKLLRYTTTIIKYGTSYAIATSFFPRTVAKKVIELYRFVRVPDNVVDHIKPWTSLDQHYEFAHQKLEMMHSEWTIALQHQDVEHFVRGNYVRLFIDNKIDQKFAQAFFEAMKSDCVLHRYMEYNDLTNYMYGSAVVVWLMMNRLMWVDNVQADEYAKKLGEAMQLTNFLRDIKEDYLELWRIYVPEDVLSEYGLSHQTIIDFCMKKIDYESAERKKHIECMKNLIGRCRILYQESKAWIAYLPEDCRKAVMISGALYEGILDKIEKNNYDVFTRSARTTLLDKLVITWKSKK